MFRMAFMVLRVYRMASYTYHDGYGYRGQHYASWGRMVVMTRMACCIPVLELMYIVKDRGDHGVFWRTW